MPDHKLCRYCQACQRWRPEDAEFNEGSEVCRRCQIKTMNR